MGKHKEKERKKKKKTTIEEHPEPSKAKTASSPTKNNIDEKLDMKIEVSGEKPDKLSPVLGYFPSGYDPLKHQTDRGDSKAAAAEVKLYQSNRRTGRFELVVSPNGSRVDFVGTNYSGEATAPHLCTYGLGVLDKTTQTLRIVPIAGNKIFRLEPNVPGADKDENKDPEAVNELTEEGKAEKARGLDYKYSTKKAINRAKKTGDLSLKEGPGTQLQMDQKLNFVELNKDALEVAASTAASARNIPPYNLEATTPETTYPLDKIIFKGEWDYLLDILEISRRGEKTSADVFPSFVCNRLHKLEDFENEAEKKQFAAILSYITHLVKFKDKHSMDGISSAKHHKIPGILFQKFSTMFGSEAKRLFDEKLNLLISYVLVLTLYADDFRTDPSDIAKDLRMSPMSLRPHYQYLGCKLVSEKKITFATLPVPLKFLEEGRRKRKRR